MESVSLMILKPLIEKIVSNLIVPKIEKLSNKLGIEYDKLLIPRNEHFSEYFYRTYKRYSTVNTLAFKNNQMLLKNIYVPLTLIIKKEKCGEKVSVDSYPKSLISKYSNLLIIDTAGMGKSTISKRMFIDVIDNGYGIPIFIELRRLSKGRSLIMEIQQQLNSLTKDFNNQLMLELLQMGGFIFFLDGYDEISLSEREYVTRDLQDFIAKATNNVFILTSRPESALTSFGNFQQATIQPLKKKEAYELLRKYDNQGETSKRLIEKLESQEYHMIDDFLQNPLLVSLLFVAFDYKQTIPLKKHIFYRQVYDAHFDSHDLSKGDGYVHEKKSKLDIDDFDKILRFIGFECIKQQKIEFSKDELLLIIEHAKTFCVGITFNASDLFEDLLKSVPLFCQDGGYYKWVHKSLQEYFAAQFIFKDVKENQNKVLEAIYNSNNIEKYYNLLDLYYDIDTYGFRKNILLPLLKEYKSSFDCEEEMTEVNIRKGLLFKRKAYLFLTSKRMDFHNVIDEIRKMDHDFRATMGWVHSNEKRKQSSLYYIGTLMDGGKRMLLALLYNKKASFISMYNKRYKFDNIYILKDDIVYAIDCDIRNPINSYSLWQEINSLISFGGEISNSLYIDIKNCNEEIKKIEQEIKIKENSWGLLNGL
jgi:hypothetical protein